MKTRVANLNRGDSTAFIVGIDIGGSSTRLAIASAGGELLGVGQAAGAGFTEVSVDESARRIRQAWLGACRVARLSPQKLVDALFAGFGSLASPDAAKIARRCIRGSRIRTRRIEVGHDSENAQWGALGGQSGIHVIAGTGSVVSAKDTAGRVWRVGGWGPWIGDEGSAWWIACEGMRHLVEHTDYSVAPGPLGRQMLRALGIKHPRGLLRAVFSEAMTRSEFAALARTVIDQARNGDQDARKILANGAAALGRQVTRAAELAKLTSSVVTFSGGMFSHCPGYARQVIAAASKQGCAVRLTPSAGTPLAGALLLAQKQLSLSTSAHLVPEKIFLQKISRSLNKPS